MYLTIHGHFYQPPREDPWTGRIPLQPSAAPSHDWNARIASQCYAPNARSRVLDEKGRIEEIVNTYEWIHFDFGPTLLRWLETEEPATYAAVLAADERSRARFGGHGNAIAQAYNHMILPLANDRDKRTQVLWGLKDFEHRFGRRSESIWLPETAVDLETLRVLIEFGIRYVILAPHQAKRVRPLGGGAWTDVSGGKIDPRRAYRWRTPGSQDGGGPGASIDVFFYDGPISIGVSFEHLLRNASTFADRLQAAARGADADGLVHLATDGEVYGHHEPFGDMCLAYLIAREGPLRGFQFVNYGRYLDIRPPQHEVEIDFGDHGEGSSWSCAHGVHRWVRDCGCAVGGQPGWNQKWRSPLRRGLNHLRDRLLEVYVTGVADLVRDPWEARDDYIDVLLDPAARGRFLERHARRALSLEERTRLWRLLESQHHAMLMFTSCAWFFADISGIEARQNLAYAARAIELAQPYSRKDLEEGLLVHLAASRSNLRELGTGAEIWRTIVRPMRRTAGAVAVEATGLLAAGEDGVEASSPAFAIDVADLEGKLHEDGIRGRLRVRDLRTEETSLFDVAARGDPKSLLNLRVRNEEDDAEIEVKADDLPAEVRTRIVRALLADRLAHEETRFDAIFESSRPLIERFHASALVPPPIFQAVARHAIDRRFALAASRLREIPPERLEGPDVIGGVAGLRPLAASVGVEPATEPLARVIEEALDANLRDARAVSTAGVARCLGLLQAAEEAGIPIHRTLLEQRVYDLLSHHRTAVTARLIGRAASESGVDPDALIRLAEHSNLSLRLWEAAPAHSA